MKTLLVALIGPNKSKQTREGAVQGLMGVGKEAVRKGLVEGGGARVIGNESSQPENSPVVSAVMDAFRMLSTPSTQPRALNPSDSTDAGLISELRITLGDFFMDRVSRDAEWAKDILHGDMA